MNTNQPSSSGITPDSTESNANAIRLQTCYRKHLAKKRVDKLMAERTWNILDNHSEEEILRKGKKFGKVSKTVASRNQLSRW